MQFSRALRALPVVCWLGASAPDASLAAQARYRISTDGDVEPVATVVSSRTAADSDTTAARLTPGRSPGDEATPGRPKGLPDGRRPGVSRGDTGSSAADPNRVESARRTVLYRAPEGAPTGTLAPSAPLRVLGRSGEWTRVEIDGWVRSGDLQAAPAGALVGVSAG